MPTNDSIPPFSKKEFPFSNLAQRARINQAVAKLNSVSPISGGANINVDTTGAGTTISAFSGVDYEPKRETWGVIVDNDYTDARYLVQFVSGFPVNAMGQPTPGDNVQTYDIGDPHVVTNRMEVPDGGEDPTQQTHKLPVGLEVLCHMEWIATAASSDYPDVNPCAWSMYVPVSDMATIQLDDTNDSSYGAGFYSGKLLTGRPDDVDPTSDLDLPDDGETVSSQRIVFENVAESSGDTGTPLAGGIFVVGYFAGKAASGASIGEGGSSSLPLYRSRDLAVNPVRTLVIVSGDTLGCGYYWARPFDGSVTSADTSSAFYPPQTGEGVDASLSPVIFENLGDLPTGGGPATANSLPVNQIVTGVLVGYTATDGTPIYRGYAYATPLFPVTCTYAYGDPGGLCAEDGKSNNCSFTYTCINALTGQTMTSGSGTYSPECGRIPNVKYNQPGSCSGLGYMLGINFHLYSVSEEYPLGATVTNVIGMQINDSDQTIQILTQQQVVLDASCEASWSTIYTGSVCSS